VEGGRIFVYRTKTIGSVTRDPGSTGVDRQRHRAALEQIALK
jgi:hypothetical protein